MAKRCPDGRWSAVGSVYPEECLEHMNLGAAVAVVLFFMFLVLCSCIWCVAWDWTEREKPYYCVEPLLYCNDQSRRSGGYRDSVYAATRVACP
jgi:hypothetical protein